MVGRTTPDVLTDWAAVVAIGCALPGSGDRRPALRFRGGTLAGTTAPDPGSFALRVAEGEEDVLFDTDPATFWQTGHYRGGPALPVRHGTAAGARIALLPTRAWWDRATRADRAAWRPRP